jgi:hypothetical protein
LIEVITISKYRVLGKALLNREVIKEALDILFHIPASGGGKEPSLT